MLNKLTKFFQTKEVAKPQPVISKQELKRAVNDVRQVPRYPPFDNGVPAIDIDAIVETQADLINRIKIAFGMPPTIFDDMVMASIRSYATYVHLLPATNRENHNNAGGLFRLGLEVGFFALQAADGKIFSTKESAEKRRLLHPKWVFATFIAGLCSEIYRPLTTMSVVSTDGQTWPSFMRPLYSWATEIGSDNYYIHWADHSDNNNQIWHSAASGIISLVIPQSCLQYIHNDNAQIVSYMYASINGAARHSDGNLIGDLVRMAKDTVIDKDIKSNATFYGKLTVGSHLEPHIIDIMRELIRDGIWTVNGKQSRIWYTKEGCFIVWTAAFNDITNVMTNRKIVGIPTSSDTLAEMLLNSGLLEQQRDGSPYWNITLPNNPKLVETVKLVDPSIILPQSEIDQANVTLMNPVAQDFFKSISAPPIKPSPVKPTENKQKTGNTADKSHNAELTTSPTTTTPDTQTKAQSDSKASLSAPPSVAAKVQNAPAQQQPQKTNVSSPATTVNPDIINQISEGTRNLINAIKADMLINDNEYPVWMSAVGLIISKEEFESHGMPHIKALDELLANNWIVRDQETGKNLHNKEKDGVKVRAYVINKAIALAIGFKDNDA